MSTIREKEKEILLTMFNDVESSYPGEEEQREDNINALNEYYRLVVKETKDEIKRTLFEKFEEETLNKMHGMGAFTIKDRFEKERDIWLDKATLSEIIELL